MAVAIIEGSHPLPDKPVNVDKQEPSRISPDTWSVVAPFYTQTRDVGIQNLVRRGVRPQNAEDDAQEAVLGVARLVQNGTPLADDPSKRKGLMTRSMWNEENERRRHEASGTRRYDLQTPLESVEHSLGNGNPEETLVEQENQGEDYRVAQAIFNSLSLKYKRILYLKYWTNFTNEEIGEMLGIKAHSVAIQFNRALKMLQGKAKPWETKK